ncbi:DegV family protein [Anaerotignum sp.]|uniref:DegV family protein n=1 Tax=Anaerotignum sp. TaxID=2039241 RepID=UPI002A91AADF|nr:DegV family protein [Anaerotignum sp.]MCI7656727.1 DegV family protein [Clostridia bacterium]MDY5414068.1 DegV family protein [Anaerotignum sp.]
MHSFQIFSDGACDFTLEAQNTHNISVVPFYVSFDGKTYLKELKELTLDCFYHHLIQEKGFPKTSLPSVHDFVEAFTPALKAGKDILSLHITHTLSGSMQSALTAKLMLEEEFPDAKIHIVDSFNATGSQALLLMEAARMQQDGKSLEEVVSYLEQAKKDTRIIFMIGGLTHLQHGGRIGKIAALSSNILKIKPIIILRDGEIHVGGATRSRKKGIAELVKLTAEHFRKSEENPADYIAMVGTTDVTEEISPAETLLKNELPQLELLPALQIGATIAAHTGPGTTGICIAKRYECYDL